MSTWRGCEENADWLVNKNRLQEKKNSKPQTSAIALSFPAVKQHLTEKL